LRSENDISRFISLPFSTVQRGAVGGDKLGNDVLMGSMDSEKCGEGGIGVAQGMMPLKSTATCVTRDHGRSKIPPPPRSSRFFGVAA
jgi:hypothetical protein